MKITIDAKLNMKDKAVSKAMHQATREGLRDVIVKMHEDTQKLPPIGSPWKTGNNRRSIASEVSGMGIVAGTNMERVCDPDKDEAAVYSTSGYGGWLEVGSGGKPARPYIKPAFDRHKDELVPRIKEHLASS